ncbi:hypothetical protein FQN50_009390, partial [Emmonsiellopsis sp. PD_5]
NFLTAHKAHFHYINLLSVVIGRDERATAIAELLQGTRTMVMAPLIDTNTGIPSVDAVAGVADVARPHVDEVDPRLLGNRGYMQSSDTPEGVKESGMEIARRCFGGGVEDIVAGIRIVEDELEVGCWTGREGVWVGVYGD